ncbi:DUF4126 domain-containing protein [Citromicrobium bathyomarinum]|uniref:DUF4126 domain-containing protein n=1 Tax=Alphaproteobacteria TaxID=28211 RepID=UPI000C11E91D|nr:DUF4126 domain-containing protein [Henriciella sp.]MBO81069.1 hypothetical protein [Citromicrobium sp.]PHR74485.1 MAG: hypothetical protein COA64_14420 [Henriciella sp.]|tara:strand:- start:12672 stop:13277 length:606 start_codon:yes stop_codon:yes gene_type:complete
MGIIELLGLAGSVSLLSGWRLYATVLITGLAMRSGWVPLPEQLQMLDVLANPWVLGIAGVGAVMEFFADKVMWLDSIWDAVHSLIRPVGGALLALAIIDPGDPTWQVIAFLLGGGAAFAAHAGKASARAAVNTSPEPVSNVMVSTAEDVATVGLLALAIANPVIAAVIAVGLLALSIALIVLVGRTLRRIFRPRPRQPGAP